MLAWKTLVKNIGDLVVARINSTVLSVKKRITKSKHVMQQLQLRRKIRHDHDMMHDMAIMM